MRILILGGTIYLGRHLVDAARAAGHDVTLFNRGRSNPGLFPDVRRLRGDRENDLSALGEGDWECVIDTSGYLPSTVAATVRKLRESIDHYTFVSSISVYEDNTRSGLTEADPVAKLDADAPEALTPETYGALKAKCESALATLMPDRHAVIRAGLIYGPHDATDRSGYWPLRMNQGGEVLAPGTPDRRVQLIDVRDLAEWIVRAAEARITGVFNATGPAEPLTMGRYLETCREVSRVQSQVTWVEESFLLEREVTPFNELPLWVPDGFNAFGDVSCAKAQAAGLTYRPLDDTLRATLEWVLALPPGPRVRKSGIPLGPGMTREREAELLAEWRTRHAAGSNT